MNWWIKPYNYSQVLPRNFRNVAYRREGSYKGMGRGLGQVIGPGYVCPDGSTVMYSQQCPQGVPAAAASGTPADQLQAQLAAMGSSGGPFLQQLLAAPSSPIYSTTSTTQWLPLALGAAVLLLVIVAAKR